MALSGAATAAATGSRVPGPLRRAHEQTRLILQAQSQEEESGAQQFERELVEKAAERWVSQKAAPVHDARGWAARCQIKGTQTAKVRAPLMATARASSSLAMVPSDCPFGASAIVSDGYT
ncbi:hypothetical protein GG804_24635 [Sphingomonas histidinilytica]|uniref:hypothetical protein n=1 Tax=Rhizorhabdus histidinilytica TaxID=439228 RepID=UPI001ADB8E51|nr:hypothetical protein [Rhizorhabdus histidinilytica]MBO9379962.1 hypothetical protein [Rhizorhabdus histidinilytica]